MTYHPFSCMERMFQYSHNFSDFNLCSFLREVFSFIFFDNFLNLLTEGDNVRMFSRRY
jgi:hypothetical protein